MRPEVGFLGDRDGLERTGIKSMQDSMGAVDVRAAEGDDSTRDPAECVHQQLGLRSAAENTIQDHVGC